MVGFPGKQIPRQGLSYLLGKWSQKTPRGSGEVRQERESSQSRSVTRKLVIRGNGGAVPWGHGRALWSTHLGTIPQPEAARLLYLSPPSPSVIGCLLGTSTARPVQTEVRKGGQSTESTYHLPRRCIWGSFVEVLGACGDPQIAVKYSTKNPHLYCGERGGLYTPLEHSTSIFPSVVWKSNAFPTFFTGLSRMQWCHCISGLAETTSATSIIS